MTVKIAVLLSGGGTTLANLIEKIDAGHLDAELICVLSSKPGVKGLAIARDAGIPAFAVPRKAYETVEEFSSAITELVDRYEVDLVCLAGFLSLWRMPERFYGRVMNIHPALIPLFCGKGFYGHRVHEAVVESGVRFSGCTVHFADDRYDTGPIILQRTVPVHTDDTPDDVAARVFTEECEAYPEAIRLFAAGRLEIVENRVEIRPFPVSRQRSGGVLRSGGGQGATHLTPEGRGQPPACVVKPGVRKKRSPCTRSGRSVFAPIVSPTSRAMSTSIT